MHPALVERIEIIRAEKAVKLRKEQNTERIQAAVDLGEIKLDGNKLVVDNLTMIQSTRTTYLYSPAVSELQDQERFEGIAHEKSTTSYRFQLKDD